MVFGGGSRRVRRSRGGGSSSSILPTTRNQHNHNNPPHNQHSVSCCCCYCDYKIFNFNEFIYSLGRKHAGFLKIWFSIGTGFGIASLFGVTLLLLLLLHQLQLPAATLNTNILFGLSMSVADAGYILISTFISVAVHEFGHAIAAASEGIQIEYIAIYVALLFPGALVAFNYDSLLALPQVATLRIYCAGVWHNAACCAACALGLFVLPLILSPFYIHGENLMVLDVKSTSPLSSYLSRGDVIESLDGFKFHYIQEWNEHSLGSSNDSDSSKKGYCIPNAWLEEDDKRRNSSCPDGLTPFSSVPCSDSNPFLPGRQCYNVADVVQLKKCGQGWVGNGTNENNRQCSQEEACLMPVLDPGNAWVEITYSRPYSEECLLPRDNSTSTTTTNCGGTFVFIGDALSVKSSVELTEYQPRWAIFTWALLDLPKYTEKLLICTFHVSLTLALLNSLPVFLLDGESILEVAIGYIHFLSSRKKALLLRICLLGGSLLSLLAFIRVLFQFL
ncbi:S2P endopeptidase [Ranunculus cassubicifolius]